VPPQPPSLTRDQVRELDRIAIEEYGIPGVVLMENAGRACAEAAAEMLGTTQGRRVVVVCGRGNNGGDGLVIARHLANGGADVHIIALAPVVDMLDRESDAAVNLRIALEMGIRVQECHTPGDARALLAEAGDCSLIVDAMLGTGISGPVREPYRTAIDALNEAGRAVLAVDLPSGLDCDTGEPLGTAVRADRTVTFVACKAGFAASGASDYAGEVTVAEISIPAAEVQRMLGGCC
jgi:NAD(P)H-hydrate epimerase